MIRRTPKLSIAALLCLAAAFALAACGGQDDGKGEQKAAKGGTADQQPADGATPKIVAVEETYNFGKVKQGVDPEHVFKIRNEGKADLRIEKARGS